MLRSLSAANAGCTRCSDSDSECWATVDDDSGREMRWPSLLANCDACWAIPPHQNWMCTATVFCGFRWNRDASTNPALDRTPLVDDKRSDFYGF